MKKEIDSREIAVVSGALMTNKDCRMAVKYLDEKTIVRATWHNKPNMKNNRETMVVSIGAPNYLEREFIRKFKKAGEPFPVKKIQFKFWPKKK